MPAPVLRAATRGSELALWQTSHVASLMTAASGVTVEQVVVETAGDLRQDVHIWEIGGRGVFVKEVQTAVLQGRADFAVHSAKDLPSSPTPGLVLAAVPARADARDALLGATLEGLPIGGLVATGSVRRRAQLASLRPDLTFTGLRGNIGTRLAKASGYAGIVMAAAALDRLGHSERVAELLDSSLMVPQVGQGALAVEAREDDLEVLGLLEAVQDGPSRLAVDAERAYLAEIGGGCDLPVGAYARLDASGRLRMDAVLASLDGRVVLRASGTTTVGDGAGHDLGRPLARRLLDESGGAWLLESLRGLA
ncbi:MAG TPA: hydroxymethylbilane synthase [Acidimicrobiales bacterium]|nr:hydroxymethylbilane synthase [Acidimicrobiales bacterium]